MIKIFKITAGRWFFIFWPKSSPFFFTSRWEAFFCKKLKKDGSWSKISNLQQVRDFSFLGLKVRSYKFKFKPSPPSPTPSQSPTPPNPHARQSLSLSVIERLWGNPAGRSARSARGLTRDAKAVSEKPEGTSQCGYQSLSLFAADLLLPSLWKSEWGNF